jgi:hypothetical protein
MFCLFRIEPLVSCERSVYVFILLLFLQDKLLNKLDEKEQDEAKTPEEEVGLRLIRYNNIMYTRTLRLSLYMLHMYNVYSSTPLKSIRKKLLRVYILQ